MSPQTFRKDDFRYDPDPDVYICPAGETLSPNHEGKLRDLKKIDYSKTNIPLAFEALIMLRCKECIDDFTFPLKSA
jgi:hypothetical protein